MSYIAHEPSQPILTTIRDKLNRHLYDRRSLYESFSRASGFNVDFGERACFDHESSTVILGIDQLKRFGVIDDNNILDPERLDWIVYHELGHWLQLLNNPSKYREFIAEGRRSDGFGRAAFEFYNCCLDLHTNSNIAHTYAVYRGDGAENIREFYRNALFNESDLSKYPLCQQFSYAILLSGMGIKDQYTFSQEIEDIFDKPIVGPGRRITTVSDFINQYLTPSYTSGRSPNQDELKILKYVIDKYLKPIWESLLKRDTEAGRTITVKEELIDGDISDEDVERISRIKKERQKDSNDRAKDLAKRQLDDVLSDVPEKERDDFFKTLDELKPVIAELVEIWRRIVRPTDHISKELVDGQTDGSVNVKNAINRFADLQNNPSTARVFEKRKIVHTISHEPKNIDLYLLLDLSGSMGELIPAIKKTFTAIGASVISFNETAKAQRLDVNISLHIVVYSNDARFILSGDLDIRSMVKAFKELVPGGNTNSHKGLSLILDFWNRLKRSDPNYSERLSILLEVTDGETSSPESSKRYIDELANENFICGGIRFTSGYRPDDNESEEKRSTHEPFSPHDTFREIWGSRGKIIGHIGLLTKTIAGFLREVLEDI